MKPRQKPTVIVVVSVGNRAQEHSARRRVFFRRADRAVRIWKKVPVRGCNRVQAVSKPWRETDILADRPLPVRAAAYVFTLLCFMGIVPMALATAVGWVIDVLNCAWVLPVGVAAVCVYGYRRCGL